MLSAAPTPRGLALAGAVLVALLLVPLALPPKVASDWPPGHGLDAPPAPPAGDQPGPDDAERDGEPDGEEGRSAPKIVIKDISLKRGKEEGFSNPVTRITVTGTVDLPDHAELLVRLAETTYRMPFIRSRGSVSKGTFTLEMGPYERPLFPGTYEIGVVFFPERQPRKAGEAVLRRSSSKAARRWTWAGDQAAEARKKSLERTRETLKKLEQLADKITVWTKEYRALDKAKKLPASGAERAKQEAKLGGWAIEYDKVREGHDDRLDEYLILPTPRTEQEIIKLINLLMDFQYECKARVTGDKDFMVERSFALFSRLRIRTRNAFRFEEILLSPKPKEAVRAEILRLTAMLKKQATAPLPARDALIAQLDAGKAIDGDRRRLALYRQLLAWRSLRDEYRKDLKEAARAKGDTWLETVNRWLHTFRAAPRTLPDVPGGNAVAARLALATLLEVARASSDGGHFAALTAEEAPALQPLDAMIAKMVDRLDLREAHRRELRLQWARIADLCVELSTKLAEFKKMERFGPRDWDDFRTPWSTALLRLMETELEGVGPLAGDKERLAAFASGRERIRDVLMVLTRHQITIEMALMMKRPPDLTAALAVVPELDKIRDAARKRAGEPN